MVSQNGGQIGSGNIRHGCGIGCAAVQCRCNLADRCSGHGGSGGGLGGSLDQGQFSLSLGHFGIKTGLHGGGDDTSTIGFQRLHIRPQLSQGRRVSASRRARLKPSDPRLKSCDINPFRRGCGLQFRHSVGRSRGGVQPLAEIQQLCLQRLNLHDLCRELGLQGGVSADGPAVWHNLRETIPGKCGHNPAQHRPPGRTFGRRRRRKWHP